MSGLSPSDIGAILQGVGTLAGAFAVAYAAWLASNTFESWRKQKLSERQIEQAERILTATYNARRALEYVRAPFISKGELNEAEATIEKNDKSVGVTKERTNAITAQVYFTRLNAVLDTRRAVEDCLPMARALFGPNVEEALNTLGHQFHLVKVAAEASIWDAKDHEFQRSNREDLSTASGTDRPNQMNDRIDLQVKAIEDACVPFLRLESGR